MYSTDVADKDIYVLFFGMYYLVHVLFLVNLVSFCYLRNQHIGSILARYWLGKISEKTD